jgi:hypothetical protein
MKKIALLIRSAFLAALIVGLAACSPAFGPDEQALQDTLVALRVKQTVVSLTQVSMTQPPGPLPATASAAPEAPAAPGTPQPQTALPRPVAAEPPYVSLPEPDQRLLKSARILLFEDMSASRYTRLVKTALDQAGYYYVDVGSAQGWFKTQLLSNQDWDLVIAAAEADRGFGGELFQYMDDRLAAGSSVILETWNLDAIGNGQASSLLDRCGVQVQSDWFQPDLQVFFWLQPKHPLFQYPNQIAAVRSNVPIWTMDAGDLLEVPFRSDQLTDSAILLAGTNPDWKTDHGVLALCDSGQMILQTFRSHDYDQYDMIRLWQNYIFYLLSNRFARTGFSVPTPAATALPGPQPSPEIPGPTPGPEYIFAHSCGGLMTAQLTSSPLVQTDLFEHHSSGIFQILNLVLDNRASFPIQIWDGDYSLEGSLDGQPVSYNLDRDATGYLYIEGPGQTVQGLLQPGQVYPTRLAFDVDPRGSNWTLVIRPGSEFNQQVCEVRLSLQR